jgi:hypothetical protein
MYEGVNLNNPFTVYWRMPSCVPLTSHLIMTDKKKVSASCRLGKPVIKFPRKEVVYPIVGGVKTKLGHKL